ncbi:MAG: VWA domain-containing protein [Clostridiales bacterium]|nr:VWA domain-containing protein [Clostridiales bacterium]
MSSISFANIYLLFLAIPLVALFVVPFALAIRRDNINGHNLSSLVLHLVMAVIIAFAATSPTITQVLTETHVYVVADVSYSASKNLDTIDNYVQDLKLPANTKLGLIAFGKDCQLLSELGDPQDVKSVKEATVDSSETNITQALEFAATQFTSGVIKRIVLITDGKQTDDRDSSAIKKTVDKLELQNIKVDAIYIDSNIKEGTDEVQLSYVNYTKNIYIGKEESVNVVVQTGKATDARITLYKEGVRVSSKSVNLSLGINNVQFVLDTAQAGSFDYSVTVEANNDTNPLNNTCSFTQVVTEELKVLFITGVWADFTAAVAKYGEKTQIDLYEYSNENRSVKNEFTRRYANNPNVSLHTSTTEVPFTVETLSAYDEIILSNADITKLTNYTEFMLNLDTVVAAYGKSLITIGNMYVQTGDAPELNQLEDMLPVRYGNRDEDPKIYTIIIDASRSMEFLSHLVVAKQVAKALVNLLNDKDQICIVSFYSDVRIIQAPTPLSNRAAINRLIDNISATQGTVIGKGLKAAYELIKGLEGYSDKQTMLITDGLSYTDEADDPVEVAADMFSDGIVTSVFDVGRQGDTASGANPDSVASAAKQMLVEVAKEGHGNYYYSNNLENMDSVTFGDIADELMVTIIEKDTAVKVSRRTDRVLENFDITDVKQVSGYVYSTAKSSATTVLTVEHERSSGTKVDRPLYSYWKYGNGIVASFTSSISGEWIQYWDGNGTSDVFFANVLDTNVPSERHSSPYTVDVIQEGKFTTVTLTPKTVHFNATATIEIVSPDGNAVRQDMEFAASYYFYQFESAELGRYELNVVYYYNNVEYADTAVSYVNFAPEYDEFTVYDSSSLHKAIDGRGTVVSGESLTLSNNDDEVGRYTFNLTIPLLIACIAIYLVDIIVRKLKWNDVVSFLGLNKQNKTKNTGGKG